MKAIWVILSLALVGTLFFSGKCITFVLYYELAFSISNVLTARVVSAAADEDDDDTAPIDSSSPKVNSKIATDTSAATDADAVAREEGAIKLDGLSVQETKTLRDKAEKHQFQAEVNRMMKLIINSLYRNKEVGYHLVTHVSHVSIRFSSVS
jgi:hypothetical protein